MPQDVRRITTIDTVPTITSTFPNGTFTSNTDTTVITYTGTDDIPTIFNLPENFWQQRADNTYQFWQNLAWFYSAAGTPALPVKIVGITNIGPYVPPVAGVIQTNTYAFQLASGVSGLNGSAGNYTKASLYGWSLTNDGGTTAQINGVDFKNDWNSNDPQLAPARDRAIFMDVILVNANGGSVLVVENS